MFLKIIFVVILASRCNAQQVDRKTLWWLREYARDAHLVLIRGMNTYYEASLSRIRDTKEMRYMYEESPFYEEGYVLSEILERYRKSAEHVSRTLEVKSNTVFDVLKRTELLERLHLEIYHLCNMMHEIRLKFRDVPEFMLTEAERKIKHQQEIDELELEKQRKLEQKKKKKMMKKMKKKLGLIKGSGAGKGPPNKWPLEYGWEMSYQW